MILLDIVLRWPITETVFHRYDEKAGVCLCCTCLFHTVEEIAERFALDLTGLIKEIENTAAGGCRYHDAFI
jgi:hypothetical protein